MELQVRDQKASGNGLNTDTSTQALAMTTDSADPEGPWNCRAQDLTFLEDWLAEWKWAQRREFPTSHPLGALSSPSTPTPIFLLFSWDHHDTDRATRWGGGALYHPERWPGTNTLHSAQNPRTTIGNPHMQNKNNHSISISWYMCNFLFKHLMP